MAGCCLYINVYACVCVWVVSVSVFILNLFIIIYYYCSLLIELPMNPQPNHNIFPSKLSTIWINNNIWYYLIFLMHRFSSIENWYDFKFLLIFRTEEKQIINSSIADFHFINCEFYFELLIISASNTIHLYPFKHFVPKKKKKITFNIFIILNFSWFPSYDLKSFSRYSF